MKQRQVLELLTRPRLAELAAGFELDVAARTPKAELVETLARSKRASFERLLGALSRDELKEICRAHGLDDSGREKAKIAERILGSTNGAAATEGGKAKKRRSKANGGGCSVPV